jgi:hypothetical protein
MRITSKGQVTIPAEIREQAVFWRGTTTAEGRASPPICADVVTSQ